VCHGLRCSPRCAWAPLSALRASLHPHENLPPHRRGGGFLAVTAFEELPLSLLWGRGLGHARFGSLRSSHHLHRRNAQWLLPCRLVCNIRVRFVRSKSPRPCMFHSVRVLVAGMVKELAKTSHDERLWLVLRRTLSPGTLPH